VREETTDTVAERDSVQSAIISILENMTSKWERAFDDRIGPQTRLAADLGLDSMQLVQLVVKIEKHFRIKDLPFHKLLISEENVKDDLRVADVVDFMEQVLNEE